MICSCSVGEMTVTETIITDVQHKGTKGIYVFDLENGYSIKVEDSHLWLYADKQCYKLKDASEAFLWQMAEVGDTVRPFKTEKGWMYKAPSKKAKITNITEEGITLSNGTVAKSNNSKVSFYKNGYKIHSFKDKKIAFLWKTASVGQMVDLTGEAPQPIGLPTIVDIQPLAEYVVYYLSNTQEVWVETERLVFFLKDRQGKEICAAYFRDNLYYRWMKAQKGQSVEPGSIKFLLGSDDYIFVPVDLPDYQVEKTVAAVKKYDGSMSELKGDLKGSRGVFWGNVDGKLRGNSASSEDFFVNIYFEGGGAPISVNAKDNPLWLDIEVGDIVIEQRLNGVITYSPKF